MSGGAPVSSGESKPERTGTPFRGPVETEESDPGPQNINIRTGTLVPGPQYNAIFKLFTSTRYSPQHVLYQLPPPPKHTGYNLRSRGHGFTLSVVPSEFMRKNFLNRMLYSDIY